ncbi:MAG TPA: PQQ-binding-like beta-propeller repeat protein, partial [Planctomycetota bacterium]|nr:PQQ-binding-like beta-propeller repeat protein [Planctomycetota bacterium]
MRKSVALLRALTILVWTSLCASTGALGDDWPSWRGPERNGISKEKGLLREWPKEGPKLLWQAKDLGGGYSTPSVVGEHLYLVTNEGLESESVEARKVEDGSKVWSTRIGKVGKPDQQPEYPGARSTPTVDGDVLYALGSDGDLVCLDRASGDIRWKKSLRDESIGGVAGTWAYAESPLVDGDRLIVTPGGSVATMAAFDKKSGDLVWRCAVPGGGEAAYASTIIVE